MRVTCWFPLAADTTLAMDSSRYATEALALDHPPDFDVRLLTFMATVSMDCGCPATYTVPNEPEPNCWNRVYCGSPWPHGVKEQMVASSCSCAAIAAPWLGAAASAAPSAAPWPGATGHGSAIRQLLQCCGMERWCRLACKHTHDWHVFACQPLLLCLLPASPPFPVLSPCSAFCLPCPLGSNHYPGLCLPASSPWASLHLSPPHCCTHVAVMAP